MVALEAMRNSGAQGELITFHDFTDHVKQGDVGRLNAYDAIILDISMKTTCVAFQ